jgi:hypothetical protein
MASRMEFIVTFTTFPLFFAPSQGMRLEIPLGRPYNWHSFRESANSALDNFPLWQSEHLGMIGTTTNCTNAN